jgi:processive 1,2-diacylglycerol beta-glucosyltransferase
LIVGIYLLYQPPSQKIYTFGGMMIELFNDKTGDLIGEISESQLQFLIDQLEEESMEDRDYAINRMTLAFFESQSADPELLDLLEGELGDKSEIIIRWTQV